MQDHYKTALQALRFFGAYLKPSSYRTDHRIKTVNGLTNLVDQYDLLILDRDGFLQDYHGLKRVPEFEDTLQLIAPKSEIASNSSINEFLKIGEIFSDLFPVSKLVKFVKGGDVPYLLRIIDHKLHVLKYDVNEMPPSVIDKTDTFVGDDNQLLDDILYNYKKPDPLILQVIIQANIQESRIPVNPCVLMCGDRYLTDVVAGNLAGIATAISKPYMPSADPLTLSLVRYLVDTPLGSIMGRLTK